MASISTNDVIVGIKTGTTWGTAVSVSGGYSLRCSQMTLSGGFDTFLPRDIGLGALLTDVKQLNFNGTISITCDTTYNQAWQHLLAMVQGREQTQAEQTGGQGDYLHCTHTKGSSSGMFSTVAWLIEDDRCVEIPSVKWVSAQYQTASNNVGSWTFTGIFYSIQVAVTNSVAILNALSGRTYESSVLGGASAYIRISSYMTGLNTLSSTHDKQISNFTATLNRPMTSRFTLRGANSPYTLEPFQTGPVRTNVTVQAAETDDSITDLISDWQNQTPRMLELYAQGTQIGSGTNNAIKLRFPYLKAIGNLPTGYDVQGNNTLMQPSLQFEALSISTAPGGFNGLGYNWITSTTDSLAAKWT